MNPLIQALASLQKPINQVGQTIGNGAQAIGGALQAFQKKATTPFTPADYAANPILKQIQDPQATALMTVGGGSGNLTRPVHQALIENALNKGDMVGAKTLIDKIAEGDPYKASMQALYNTLNGLTKQ